MERFAYSPIITFRLKDSSLLAIFKPQVIVLRFIDDSQSSLKADNHIFQNFTGILRESLPRLVYQFSICRT